MNHRHRARAPLPLIAPEARETTKGTIWMLAFVGAAFALLVALDLIGVIA